MHATIPALCAWAGLDASIESVAARAQAALLAASAAVETYLHRPLITAERTEVHSGSGTAMLLPRVTPVHSVASITVDGAPVTAGWGTDGRRVWLTGGAVLPRGLGNVAITYIGGYDPLPHDIAQAVIEIAGVMLRRGEHADVSSKALAGESISYIAADITPSARQMLAPYVRVVP